MTMTMDAEQLALLKDYMGAYRKSRVLFTATNLRVFDRLTEPTTAQEAARCLGTDERATTILLDALVSMALVTKDETRYVNSPLANQCLVSGSPLSQVDIISHNDNLWSNWSGLDDIVRTGKPNRVAHDQSAFIMGMHNIASLKVRELFDVIDLGGVSSAIDIGGGPGTYAMEMARQGIAVTLFDRQETIDIAAEVIRGAGVEGIRFLPGDFTTHSIGSGYDLAIISQVLHSSSVTQCRDLIKGTKDALNPNGKIVIHEFYIEDNMTQPFNSAMFSINMLVATEEGRCYTVTEMQGWLREAGFEDITAQLLTETVVVTGRKA
ncbi:methyltransferase [Candidatus Magnetobacterium casense]|uniref:Methyltransferase domain-containing protein n=1 Tax=Candidatus Magnetobacterium casense TaxID=1455061 RepID=A0ABS6RWD4_9BACT|nr:methyltransferase [Candidatus Magnetobacterium casensis]MBV6340937.1 methyltransferase domain-containing protein [Candidatus Magnetobacterium casensis]